MRHASRTASAAVSRARLGRTSQPPENAHRLDPPTTRNFGMRIRHATGSMLIALLSMAALAAAAPVTAPAPVRPPAAPTAAPALWIVQAASVAAARRGVAGVGAR